MATLPAPRQADLSPAGAQPRASLTTFGDTARIAKAEAVHRYRLGIVGPAMLQPKGSAGRHALLQEQSQRSHLNPITGKAERFSLRSLYAWILAIEATGHAKPKPKRAPRLNVLVSRAWDSVCPLPEESKRDIANRLEEYARGLWRADIDGHRKCANLASTWLMQASQAAGWKSTTLAQCKVTRQFVQRPEIVVARELGRKEKNAKLFHDVSTPRIMRSREAFMPGEVICTDVHPVDIYVRRDDGSVATPRMIAWLDIATNDLFYTLVLCEKGKGITQSDVCRSFAEMVEAWGFPRYIQRDNGKENDYSGMVAGLEELRRLNVGLCEILDTEADESDTEDQPKPRESMSIKALPYRPTSKPIEGAFAALESHFAPLSGYIGGDRMKKRTHAMGKEPKPYTGTWEALQEDIAAAVRAYRHAPKRGHLAERSPAEMRTHLDRAASADSYRPPSVDRPALVFAMSERMRCRVHPNGVQAHGEWFYGDDLMRPGVVGSWIEVMCAKWDTAMIWVKRPGPDGGNWVAIPRVERYGYLDVAGAVEQQRRKAFQNEKLKLIAEASPKLDMSAEVRRHAAALPADPPVNKGAKITLSPDIEQAAKAAKTPPEARALPKLAPLETISPRTGAVVRHVPSSFAAAKAEKERRDLAEVEAISARNRKTLAIGADTHQAIPSKRTT